MDRLAEELQSQILSHLTLNEQAKCRLVSRSFKCLVEDHLRTITHVKTGNDRVDTYSSAYEDFLSNKFVTAYVRTEKMTNRYLISFYLQATEREMYTEFLVDGFYSFLSKFCPKLQVLYSRSKLFHINNLFKLPSLRYFNCQHFDYLLPNVGQDTESLFTQMESLEAFGVEWISSKKMPRPLLFLAKRLMQKKKPIPKLQNPSSDLLDEETFASMAECGIKCLKYDVKEGEIDQLYPISEQVARHLKDLSFSFLPSDSFVQSPLPMLKYLSISNYQCHIPETYNKVLFTSPHLKYFRYNGGLTLHLVHRLFQHFNTLQELELVDISCSLKGEEFGHKIILGLPSSLHSFKLDKFMPVELIGCISSKLTFLSVNSLTNFEFDLPNLEKLVCEKTNLFINTRLSS